ncbi:MAG: DUF4428 domain-containing protein, partial [Clostridiales bacterium]|nr:DUF4428 domain-containing protein [Clostridiales bacterium]
MGLFDKKECDICGGKIGLLGNRKLDDGNCCKDCAKKLSPWFSDRRRSTIADIEEQLAYREANKADVAAFNTTRTLGKGTKVLLDEDAGKFMVTAARKLEDENPDVLDFSQVTGCLVDIQERRNELKRKDNEGKDISYIPPRYTYSFDFYITINVNTKWFDEIKFKLNSSTITEENGRQSVSFREYEALGAEVKEALTKVRQDVRDGVVSANAPKVAQTCPQCGATTMPDANGRCEFC